MNRIPRCDFAQDSLHFWSDVSVWFNVEYIRGMVGMSIADIYDRGIIFTKARCAKVNKLPYQRHFLLKSISLICDSAIMLNFPMVAQSPYYIISTYVSVTAQL